MTIDENTFFRESTLKICSSLDIEKAMQRCLRFLVEFIPASRMCFHIYDRQLGIVETVAMATVSACEAMALRTPLSAPGALAGRRAAFVPHQAGRTHGGRRGGRPSGSPLRG